MGKTGADQGGQLGGFAGPLKDLQRGEQGVIQEEGKARAKMPTWEGTDLSGDNEQVGLAGMPRGGGVSKQAAGL